MRGQASCRLLPVGSYTSVTVSASDDLEAIWDGGRWWTRNRRFQILPRGGSANETWGVIDLTLVHGSWGSGGGGTVTVFEAKTRQECIDALPELAGHEPGPRPVPRLFIGGEPPEGARR